jgi:hypothetical protein
VEKPEDPKEKPEEALLSVTAYAQHRGCSFNAVRAAMHSGRIGGAVRRNEEGKLLGINAVEADRLWAANTNTDHNWRAGSTDDAYSRARAKRATINAVVAEIELALKLGKLVDAQAISTEFGDVLRQIRDGFVRAFNQAESLLALDNRNAMIRASFKRDCAEVLDLLARNMADQAKRAMLLPAPKAKPDGRRKKR